MDRGEAAPRDLTKPRARDAALARGLEHLAGAGGSGRRGPQRALRADVARGGRTDVEWGGDAPGEALMLATRRSIPLLLLLVAPAARAQTGAPPPAIAAAPVPPPA